MCATCAQLDLYGVAEHNNYEHKLMTLSDMMFELIAPYGEVRLGNASPSDEQAFYLRHGETPDSLKVRLGLMLGLPALWYAFRGVNSGQCLHNKSGVAHQTGSDPVG
jgi:hypothetical protein